MTMDQNGLAAGRTPRPDGVLPGGDWGVRMVRREATVSGGKGIQ
jgi:hypothetical protein